MSNLKDKMILVVEDTEEILNFHKRWFDTIGVKFLGASTAQEGIDIYHKNNFKIDAVILDYILPDMNGDKVMEAIRELDPDVPIVICSGYISSVEKLTIDENVEILGKPFLIGALEEKLERLIGKE